MGESSELTENMLKELEEQLHGERQPRLKMPGPALGPTYEAHDSNLSVFGIHVDVAWTPERTQCLAEECS